jgi:hypothetical protein
MAKVRWDLPGTRAYNVGVDRGVLYLPDGSGVPWSGLMSLVESAGADLEEVSYFDGEKYVGEQQTSDFAAALAAVTFPDEFLQFDGYDSPEPGLLVGNQPSKSFSLSYRTLVGSDTEGTDLGLQDPYPVQSDGGVYRDPDGPRLAETVSLRTRSAGT